MFNVRLGRGSLKNLETLYDVEMPVVPRKDELILLRIHREEMRFLVQEVEYLIDGEKFLGARLSVTEVKSSAKQSASNRRAILLDDGQD